MRVTTNSNIASGSVFVKRRTPQAVQRRCVSQSQSRFPRSQRPDVLLKMPRSCNIVFDVLRSMINRKGQSRASVRYLAQVTGLSHQTTWRALRRLRGAHLIAIASASHGSQKTVWQLQWRSPLGSFPQISVTLAPIRSNTRERKAFSPSGTDRPPRSNKPSKRALAWLMAKVRTELHDYPISAHRKKAILTSIGASVWRAMKSGAVQAGGDLGKLLHELIQRLREANRIGEGVRSWSSWSGWCVHEIIGLQRAKQASDEASARRFEQSQREKAQSTGSLASLLSESGASSLRDYIYQQCPESV
jgi:hypothetical protein